jgi:ATP-dependent RNA helicase RhlE
MPVAIRELAWSILHNPEHISVHTVASTTDTIIQKVYPITRNYKRQLLQQIIKRKDLDSILVFVNTKDECERVFEFVKSSGIPWDFINRNKTQNGRQKALKALKDWNIKVLVATDIASRWLDVNDLSCVINYDLPVDSETYVHRIWRTARAWKYWLAISFCTEQEKVKLKAIEWLIKKTIEIINDDSYKNEIVPRWKSENTIRLNAKNKPKSRKKRHYGKK